jgi:Inner membrane component of T3SS, cytoplasmic domain
MERLAWIEILDRHGDVSVRYPVHAWPLRVGRDYSSDIVLDDPYVAANHLEINRLDGGRYQLTELGSINGLTIDNLRGKQTDATVSANDVIRIGQTQLRVRPPDYAVAAEKLLPNNAWLRSWPGLILGFAVLLLAHMLTLWLEYNRDESYKILVEPLLNDIPTLLLWAGFWALIGRVLSGRANFIAHAVIASMVVALIMLLNSLLFGYVDFAFNTGLMTNVLSGVTGTLIIGWLFYRHICLVSRVNRRRLGITITILMAGLFGIFYAIDEWTGDDDLASMAYSRTIGPPSMSLMHGKSTEEFIAGAGELKLKVDEIKK